MRIGCILLIGLLLGGCSSNQVTLTMRDGAKIESELLSVRDSSIVIQEKGGAPIVIRNEDVDHVLRESSLSPVLYVVAGAFSGLFTGAVIGALFPRQLECKEPTICRYTYPSIGKGALVGLGLGTALGVLSIPGDKIIHMNDSTEREDLIYFAKFYEAEPDELKKIK